MGAQFLTDVKNSVCRVLFFFSLVSKTSHLAAACINCVHVSLLAPDLQKKHRTFESTQIQKYV